MARELVGTFRTCTDRLYQLSQQSYVAHSFQKKFEYLSSQVRMCKLSLGIDLTDLDHARPEIRFLATGEKLKASWDTMEKVQAILNGIIHTLIVLEANHPCSMTQGTYFSHHHQPMHATNLGHVLDSEDFGTSYTGNHEKHGDEIAIENTNGMCTAMWVVVNSIQEIYKIVPEAGENYQKLCQLSLRYAGTACIQLVINGCAKMDPIRMSVAVSTQGNLFHLRKSFSQCYEVLQTLTKIPAGADFTVKQQHLPFQVQRCRDSLGVDISGMTPRFRDGGWMLVLPELGPEILRITHELLQALLDPEKKFKSGPTLIEEAADGVSKAVKHIYSLVPCAVSEDRDRCIRQILDQGNPSTSSLEALRVAAEKLIVQDPIYAMQAGQLAGSAWYYLKRVFMLCRERIAELLGSVQGHNFIIDEGLESAISHLRRCERGLGLIWKKRVPISRQDHISVMPIIQQVSITTRQRMYATSSVHDLAQVAKDVIHLVAEAMCKIYEEVPAAMDRDLDFVKDTVMKNFHLLPDSLRIYFLYNASKIESDDELCLEEAITILEESGAELGNHGDSW